MKLRLFAALALMAPGTHAGAHAAEAEHGFVPSQAAAYITNVQQQLTVRGYYGGAVDGQMNPSLRTAISVYQSDVGMRVTGVPDLAVVNMLNFGPEMKATIQPLGTKPAPKPPAEPVRTGGVPPYVAPEPYRYPTPERAAENAVCKPQPAPLKAEEPPLPKAAPQHRVVTSPLQSG